MTTTDSKQAARTSRTRTAASGVALIALVGTALAAAPALTATAAPTVDASPAAMLAPYYTQLDLTGDDQVTRDDVALLTAHLGATSSTDPDWSTVAAADTDQDGTITVADVAALSQRMIYDDGPFQLVEASTIDMQAAMNAGVTTSAAITQEYLDRIAAYDRTKVDPASTPPISSTAMS